MIRLKGAVCYGTMAKTKTPPKNSYITRIDDIEKNGRERGNGVISGVGRVYIKLSGRNATFSSFGSPMISTA